MKQLAIKGHQTRGKEVIEILKMLGGKNVNLFGMDNHLVYYIRTDGYIDTLYAVSSKTYKVFTLEEFLEIYPYKVGDKVIYKDKKREITKMVWEEQINTVAYKLDDKLYCNVINKLQPYKEETMKKEISDAIVGRFICLEDCNFYDDKGNIIDTREITMKKKKPKYPKTYKECCEVLGCKADDFFTDFSYNNRDVEISDYEDKIDDLLQNFRKLRYCRDAYWEIAGEEMGLGKPWEPDWNDSSPKYTITVIEDKLVKKFALIHNYILAFPTEEIRDIFFENFKDLIELCKELL